MNIRFNFNRCFQLCDSSFRHFVLSISILLCSTTTTMNRMPEGVWKKKLLKKLSIKLKWIKRIHTNCFNLYSGFSWTLFFSLLFRFLVVYVPPNNDWKWNKKNVLRSQHTHLVITRIIRRNSHFSASKPENTEMCINSLKFNLQRINKEKITYFSRWKILLLLKEFSRFLLILVQTLYSRCPMNFNQSKYCLNVAALLVDLSEII